MNQLILNMSRRVKRFGFRKTTIYHLYGLLFYSVWVLGLDLVYLRGHFKPPFEFLTLGQSLWIFYTGYAFLYLQFLGERRWRVFALPVLAGCLAGAYSFTYLYGRLHEHYTHQKYATRDLLYVCSQEFTFVFIYSLGYFFLVRYRQKQQQIRDFERRRAQDQQERLALENSNALLQQEKLLLEKDLLQSENDFLRAQINPHFLYNCLNFFYSETFERQPRLGEAVLLLSQVMRYSLSDFSATGGLARLDGELEHIRNVVEIHRMRFGGSLYIETVFEGDLRNKLIQPMVLMTLVENVMKHGDLTDPDSPAMLRCRVNNAERSISFTTVNKKAHSKSESSTGIGLVNIRQRLSRLYGSGFSLTASNELSVFTEELVIPYFDDKHAPVVSHRTLNQQLC